MNKKNQKTEENRRKKISGPKLSPTTWKRGAARSVLTPRQVEKIAIGGGVRIKEVRCGKKSCRKCPHFIYVYRRERNVHGKRVEKYLGKLAT